MLLLFCTAACENVEYPSSESSVGPESSKDFYESINSQLPSLVPDGETAEEQPFLIITNEEKVYYQDESSPGAVNTAIEERNSFLRRKYGAVIEVKTKTYNEIAKELKASTESGRYYCDMISISAKDSVKLFNTGLLYNMNKLPQFNVENAYFDPKNAKALATNSSLYLLPDPTALYYDDIYAMFFNKALLEEKGCENPETLVMQGKWTWDKYNEAYRKAASEVMNKVSANLETDVFGFSAYYGEGTNPMVMWTSCGKKLVDNTYKNEVKLALTADQTVEIATKLGKSNNSKAKLPIDGDGAAAAFKNGRLAFFVNKLDYIYALRDGTSKGSEFGVLPMPKYNESQKEYHCLVANDARVISIPATIAKAEEAHKLYVSAVVSATCAAGRTTVHDAYLNNVIGTLLFDNDEAFMFKTILESATFDFSVVFGSQISEIRRCTTGVIVDYIDVGSDIKRSIELAIDSFKSYTKTKFT